VREMLVPGLLLTFLSYVIFNVLVWTYWPLIGINAR
jgi:hypothetical protein